MITSSAQNSYSQDAGGGPINLREDFLRWQRVAPSLSDQQSTASPKGVPRNSSIADACPAENSSLDHDLTRVLPILCFRIVVFMSDQEHTNGLFVANSQ